MTADGADESWRGDVSKRLFRAVTQDDVEAVQELERTGVDVLSFKNGAKQSALQVATQRKRMKVKAYLQELQRMPASKRPSARASFSSTTSLSSVVSTADSVAAAPAPIDQSPPLASPSHLPTAAYVGDTTPPGGSSVGSASPMATMAPVEHTLSGQERVAALKQLFRAVMQDDVAAVEACIAAGLDVVNITNAAGQRPVDVARERVKPQVTEFLEWLDTQREAPQPASVVADERSSSPFPEAEVEKVEETTQEPQPAAFVAEAERPAEAQPEQPRHQLAVKREITPTRRSRTVPTIAEVQRDTTPPKRQAMGDGKESSQMDFIDQLMAAAEHVAQEEESKQRDKERQRQEEEERTRQARLAEEKRRLLEQEEDRRRQAQEEERRRQMALEEEIRRAAEQEAAQRLAQDPEDDFLAELMSAAEEVARKEEERMEAETSRREAERAEVQRRRELERAKEQQEMAANPEVLRAVELFISRMKAEAEADFAAHRRAIGAASNGAVGGGSEPTASPANGSKSPVANYPNGLRSVKGVAATDRWKVMFEWMAAVINHRLASADPALRQRLTALLPHDSRGLDAFGPEDLSDGKLLCAFAMAIRPASITKVDMFPVGRVSQFQQACLDVGLPKQDLFAAPDITPDPRNPDAVLRSLTALARILQGHSQWSGPRLAM